MRVHVTQFYFVSTSPPAKEHTPDNNKQHPGYEDGHTHKPGPSSLTLRQGRAHSRTLGPQRPSGRNNVTAITATKHRSVAKSNNKAHFSTTEKIS